MPALKSKSNDRITRASFPVPTARASCGFTLIELMLALSIAVVLVALIFSLYFAVSRTVNEQHERRTGDTAIVLALEQLTRDLMTTMPAVGYKEGGFLLETEEAARGYASQLTFCSARPQPAPTDTTTETADPHKTASNARDLRWFDAVEITYQLEYAPRERGRLLRTERPIVGPESLKPPRTNVLATGVDQFHVRIRHDEDWTDRWTTNPDDAEQAAWPRAARITLVPDQRVRGGKTRTVDVLIPVGWTIVPDNRETDEEP